MEIGTFWTFRIERLLRAWFFPSRTNWTKTRYLIGEGNEISARLSPCFRFTPFRNAKIRLCQVGTKIETCATKRFRNWSIREQRATVNRRPRNRKEYRGIREIASTIVMGFIWPSSIIGILPLAPESVSSNSFYYTPMDSPDEISVGKNFSSSIRVPIFFVFFLFLFFFLFSKESVLGHRTNYLRVFYRCFTR